MSSPRSERFQRVSWRRQRERLEWPAISLMLAGYTTAYQVFLLGLVVPIWLNMYQRASDGEAFLPSVTRHLGNFTLQVAHRPVLIALAIGLFFSFLILKRIRFTELALVVAAVLLVETVVVMSIMCLPIFSLTSLIQ